MTSKGQQRLAAAGGLASVVCGAVAFFLTSTRLQGDDAAIVAVLRGLAASGMLLLIAGARELVIRIEEHGERGRPSDTLATAVTVSGGVYAALQVVGVAALYMAATRLDTLARGSSSGGGPELGRFVAITSHVAAGFPAAVFAGTMSLALFALGRAGTVVGLVGCAAAVASVLRGFAAYPRTVRELEVLDTSVLFPVRDAMYVILTGLFGLFVAVLSVLLWLRADPRELHG